MTARTRRATIGRMKISVAVERRIEAPASRVYAYVADFRQHHPNFLPPAFSDLVVEEGGIGAGTVHRFSLTLGGRTSSARVVVDEPEPGRVLTETETERGMVTTFTVEPEPRGMSRVQIHSTWETPGIRGLVERLLATAMLRRLYADELNLLNGYARQLSRTTPRLVTAARGVVIT